MTGLSLAFTGGVAMGVLPILKTPEALAQSIPGASNKPVLLTADELRHDRERNLVIAKGNVEISQDGRTVLADQVIYNRKTKTITAMGNVSMTEPGGEIIFGKKVVLTDDLKNGTIERFRMLFPDKTRVAANGIRRFGGKRKEMSKVVFSPCNLCKEDPSRAPLWQLKARRVIHYETRKDIVYRDAWFEVFGVPIVYTPYFSHPDPTVRRRSGILRPLIGSDSHLGAFVKIPYFWAISDDKDLTIAPLITTQERAALFLEYRQRFKNGAAMLSGSYTYVSRRDASGGRISGDRSRGHLFAKFRYDLNKHWRFGLDGYWASDDTYLRQYDVSKVSVLTSTAWLEGFYGRDYAAIRAYHFQGLRTTDDYRSTPLVLPFAEVHKIGRPYGKKGRWHFSADTAILTRWEGTDSRRLSVRAGWKVPYIHASGIKVTASADLFADLYHVTHVIPANGGPRYTGFRARLFPQAKLDVRYPFVRELGNVRVILEPRAALILSPSGLNSSRIPNEDSVDFEFDDTNLFSGNRFPGRDRIDDGSRVVYGLGVNFLGNRGGETSLFVGQSLRFFGGQGFADGTGLENDLSDIVGRLRVRPASYLQLNYRFRLNASNFRARRNEISLYAGVPVFNLSAGYLLFNSNAGTSEFPNREEITLAVRSQVTKHWSVFGGGRWDLSSTGGILNWNVGGKFRNECCEVLAQYTRNFFRDRDLRPTNRFTIQLVLKHLGGISFDP